MTQKPSTILHRAILTLLVMICSISTWAQTTHVVNQDKVDNVFSGDGYTLGDAVSEGDILDFQGEINIEHSLVINKKVNIKSTSKNAVVKLNTETGTPKIQEDPGKCFVINKYGNGTTVQDIRLENTETWLYNTHNVTFTHVTMCVANIRVGLSVGHVSIRYSDYITFNNCTIHTENNGGSSACVLTGSSSCTFQNCLFETVGSVANTLNIGYSYYTDDKPEGFDLVSNDNSVQNCTFTTNSNTVHAILKINGGFRHHIEGNKGNIQASISGTATSLAEGDIIRNNTFTKNLSVPNYSIAENNTVDGSFSVTGANATAISNTINGSLTVSGANATVKSNSVKGNVVLNRAYESFTDNMVFGTLSVASNSTNNTITGNMIISADEYAVILKPTTNDANNIVQDNVLMAPGHAGDDAVKPGTGSGNTIRDNKAEGTAGDDGVTWSYNATTKMLTIGGKGNMANYEQTTDGLNTAPWAFIGDQPEYIVINENVTSIGANAFASCTNAYTVIANGMAPPTLGTDAFYYYDFYCFVPAGTLSDYKTAWGCDIISEYFSCGTAGHENDVKALYNTWTKILTICGMGSMADYSSADDQPWKDLREELHTVFIENGITAIGKNAFDKCDLGSVDIFANGLIPCGSNGIPRDCWIYVPLAYLNDYITNWDDHPSFYFRSSGSCGATGRESGVYWEYDPTEKELTIAGSYTMADYSSANEQPWYKVRSEIKSVSIFVTNVGNYAFYQCSNLTAVNFYKSVTSIGDYAFYNCSSLEAVTIPESVTSIGDYAFYNCSSLEAVTIPESVTSIGSCAFCNCKILASVTLNSNPTIGSSAFYNIKDGATVTMNLTANQVDDAYWTTFYNNYGNFQADANTAVYKGAVSESNMVLTENNDRIVTKGQAVILKSTGNPVMTLTTSASTGDYTDNELHGVSESTEIAGSTYSTNTIYVMESTVANGFGFHKYTGTYIPANKAFLMLSSPSYASPVFIVIVAPVDHEPGHYKRPIIITTAAQLNQLAQEVNAGDGKADKYYKLGNDIAYDPDVLDIDNDGNGTAESNYSAIGMFVNNGDEYIYRPFNGHFDGDGHTISGIRLHHNSGVNTDYNNYKGLFGYLGADASISNVTLTDTEITANYFVGGIAGYASLSSSITNSHVTSSVTIHTVMNYASHHGGIVGTNYGTVSHCTSAATLTIADGLTPGWNYGGIVGDNPRDGEMTDNLALGVTVPAAHLKSNGAITGNKEGTLSRNYYSGCTVAGETTNVGSAHMIPNVADYVVGDVAENDGAVPVPSATVSKEGFGTYYISAADVVLPAGMKAMIVKGKDDCQALAYETIADGSTSTKTVPAGTAVMLQTDPAADKQTIGMTLAAPTDQRDFTATNLLHGSDVAVETSGGDLYYMLSYGKDGSDRANTLGWFWGADGGAAFTSAAHKAWLALKASAGARSFVLPVGNDNTTGIADDKSATHEPGTTNTLEQGVWYSLDGRKLNGRPTEKGVYIHNGRKEVIR